MMNELQTANELKRSYLYEKELAESMLTWTQEEKDECTEKHRQQARDNLEGLGCIMCGFDINGICPNCQQAKEIYEEILK